MFDSIFSTFSWLALVAMFLAGSGMYTFTTGKRWPAWSSILSGVFAFIAVATAWFILYGATGFPGWMRWPTELLAGSLHTQSFTKPGLYSIDLTGWQHNTAPNGDVFTCSVCDAQVQVQIDYGSELTKEAIYKTNREFISAMSTETVQKQFAESIVRRNIPLQSGFTISIGRVGLSQLGGLDVFQFSAVVEMPSTISHDNSMLAIHKNHIMMLTLNYYDRAMNGKTKSAIDKLYKSIQFK